MSMVTTERRLDDVVILDLAGRITIGECTIKLREQIQKMLNAGARKFLWSLPDVDYIDSAGLGKLVSSFMRARKHEGALKCLSLTRRVRDLMQITKLLTIFHVYDDEAAAFKSFG